MPNRTPKPCTTPGCANRAHGGRCDTCVRRRQRGYDNERGTAAQRGYNATWTNAVRTPFLVANPRCALCGQLANVADHHPRSRRQLLAARVDDPDDWRWLRPLCKSCHAKQTAIHQPGGWNTPKRNGPRPEGRGP